MNICQEWDSNPRLQQETRIPKQFKALNPFDTGLSLAPLTTRPSWQLDLPSITHFRAARIHDCFVVFHFARLEFASSVINSVRMTKM